MSIKEVISQGEPFEVVYKDRSTNGKETSALKISGTGATPKIELGVAPSITGDMAVSGDANIGVDANIAGNANVTGNAIVGGRVDATGYIHTASDLSVVGSATVGGKPVLAGAPFYITVLSGVAAAGPVTATSVKIGDKVIGVINLTDDTDGNSSFEDTVTANDQIQQTDAGDLHLKKYLFIVVRQS